MVVLRRTLACLIVLLGLGAALAAAEPGGVEPLRVGEEHRALDGQVALLRDPGGQLTVADVAAPAMQHRFVALRQGTC